VVSTAAQTLLHLSHFKFAPRRWMRSLPGCRNRSAAIRINCLITRRRNRNSLELRFAAVQRRMDQAYQDKLDGNILQEFWERKMLELEWRGDEKQIQAALIAPLQRSRWKGRGTRKDWSK
jgi:hypothetical protein